MAAKYMRLTTYGEYAFSEYDNVHVEGLEVCRTVLILVETSETDEIIVPEKLNLFADFLHLDIFCGQRVNIEDLRAKHNQHVCARKLAKQHTLLSIFISSSVGEVTSNHQVLSSSDGAFFASNPALLLCPKESHAPGLLLASADFSPAKPLLFPPGADEVALWCISGDPPVP